jgi:gas vesicle protein
MAGAGPSGGGFVAGLLLGALAGATLAMIAAPQTGEETRDELGARVRQTTGRARDVASDATSDLLERGRTIVETARARVDGAIAEGREAAAQQRNDLEART